jgi:linear primary-alkylsulfatase
LFEVTDGIYQVRGLDLSNMTLVEGDRGVIVIDPLVSTETAAAAPGLYRRHRGERPVTAVIYTHSHIDHFGGVEAVTDGGVPIVAPEGFLEHAVSENVYAGPAMLRRGIYHTGVSLPVGPRGLIGTGLGQTASTGTMTLLAPTVDITHTGQEETLDGVRIVFQSTPGTEAPSEMNFYFPDRRALCMAENATHNLHNILTLRGAVVRDSRVAEPGLYRDRDRRDDPAAPGSQQGLAHPRLLRFGEPQREGDIPALPGLVRREPGAPVGAPAAGGREAVCRLPGRPGRRGRQGQGLRRRG